MRVRGPLIVVAALAALFASPCSAQSPTLTPAAQGGSGVPALEDHIARRMAFYDVPGVSVAVLVSGRILWAKGYGVLERGKGAPVDAETLFQAASISKPTTTLAALRMVEQRRLLLDAPINEFLTSWQVPDNRFTSRQAVTLRQIMSHSAGFTVHGFPGYARGREIPTVVQVLDGEGPANTPEVRVNKVPGESWRYSGGGFTVMQLAMTDASGKAFPDLMRELVLAPAGMTRSTFAQPLPDTETNAATAHGDRGSLVAEGNHVYPEMAAAGLWTTPSDLLRLGLAVVAAAHAEPNALLGVELTNEMLTTQAGSFGLGFSLQDLGDGLVFSHDGGNRGFISRFYMYADGHGGAAIMINSENGVLINEIAAAIAIVYGWQYGRLR